MSYDFRYEIVAPSGEIICVKLARSEADAWMMFAKEGTRFALPSLLTKTIEHAKRAGITCRAIDPYRS